MAYGLVYNLNFRSNIAGNRRHRLSIYKDGVANAITINDNNIIGTEEPVILIWDNTDDIYNNIMASRLEINLYSDDVKQVDVEDVLNNSNPSKFKVEFYMENQFGTFLKYWEGYLSNATYEQGISSVPVTYKLIATDLLGTLKNIFTSDGNAVILGQPSVMKYLNNIFGFLPQTLTWRIANDIELKPYKFGQTNVFTKMHFLQWLFPYINGFDLSFDTADQYIINTLKAFNARMFYANNSWYVINNSTHKDTTTFDQFVYGGNYNMTFNQNVLKTIPTNFKLLNNDLSIRYDTPIDTVEVVANRNEYTPEFFALGLSAGEIGNLSPYPNFETKVNSILYNSTYYSDDFNFIQRDPIVKKGNYSIKTQNYIATGNPTLKILDTGFAGNFQWDAAITPTFFCSYFIQGSGNETENFHLYYSLTREISASSSAPTGAKSYWDGNNWISYSNEADVDILTDNNQTAPTDQWVEFSVPLPGTPTGLFARYRVTLWQPKINGAPANQLVIYYDEVFIGRRNVIESYVPIKTISKVIGSSRKNKKYTHTFQHFYPVSFATQFQTSDITFVDTIGQTQLNRIIAQQILNDNRSHIKRYSCSIYTTDFSQFLQPYHKIDINLSGFQSDVSCIIDRLQYRAKSGFYQVECHENNQATNVSIDTRVVNQ